jgi:hypothetical protein
MRNLRVEDLLESLAKFCCVLEPLIWILGKSSPQQRIDAGTDEQLLAVDGAWIIADDSQEDSGDVAAPERLVSS